jgi:hypothetical protein
MICIDSEIHDVMLYYYHVPDGNLSDKQRLQWLYLLGLEETLRITYKRTNLTIFNPDDQPTRIWK